MAEDKVVKTVHDFFETKLPKKGKPCPEKKEWTVLSAFVVKKANNSNFDVVALGTGTKCLGQNEISDQGDLVHDSHAEVIAKRAFVLYLMTEVKKCLEGQSGEGILRKVQGQDDLVELDPDVTLYFYTSFPPCGDATISEKADEDGDQELQPPDAKRPKLNDIHRTGAKSLMDSLEPKANYHVLGAVRTKPGRGDPTLSLSCSDKMAKWCHVGFQGSLLAAFFQKPLLPHVILLGGSEKASLGSLSRALFDRFDFPSNCKVHKTDVPEFGGKNTFNKGDENRACDAAIFWNRLPIHGVIVQGRKQGCVKKHYGTAKAESPLCRKRVASLFLQTFCSKNDLTIGKKFNNLIFEKDDNPLIYKILKERCIKHSLFYSHLHKEMKNKLRTSQLTHQKESLLSRKDEFNLV